MKLFKNIFVFGIACVPFFVSLDAAPPKVSASNMITMALKFNNQEMDSKQPLLHLAASIKDQSQACRCIEQLFKENSTQDINEKDSCDRTALHIAAQFGYEKTVMYLLTKGACIDIQDQYNKFPFEYAEENGHEGVVAILNSKKKVAEPEISPADERNKNVCWGPSKL